MNYLPASFKSRACEFLGAIWMFIAFIILAALISYDAEDPSWNTVIDGTTSNVIFLGGSYISDVLFQFLGMGAYIFPVAFFIFGWQLIKEQSFNNFYLRIFFLFNSVFFLCSGLGNNISGGAIGEISRKLINQLSSLIKVPYPEFSINFFCFGTALLSLLVVINFKIEWIYKIAKTIISLLNRGNYVNVQSAYTLSKVVQTAPAKANTNIPNNEQLKETNYSLPPLNLLATVPAFKKEILDEKTISERADHLMKVLNDFGIKGEIVGAKPGPVVTLYELTPAAGIKSSRIIGLSHDIARSMSAISARVAVVPGHNVIGIELPNAKRQTVYLRELFSSNSYEQFPGALALAMGKNIGGDSIIVDLARMPHLLVAGTTGSGKSVSINTMVLSLVYRLSPEQCRFIMMDPKMLELSVYDGIPHLLTPVVTDPKKAVVALKWTVREMENRYKSMAKLGVRNIEGYNAKILEASGETLIRKVQTGFDSDSGLPIYENQHFNLSYLPYIVVIVDEMADLMLVAGKEIEGAVQRLAQMARAAGIHLIMATQRPSVDVITGTIKANFPTRVSFHVTSKIDSRTILGEQGAEQLLGQGDMLYMSTGGQITRVHGPFVSDAEVELVVNYLKTQGKPDYIDEVTEEDEDSFEMDINNGEKDELYEQALSIVLRERKASTSFIQRHLQIGYNRAARLIEKMEKEGVIGPPNHVGKREIFG